MTGLWDLDRGVKEPKRILDTLQVGGLEEAMNTNV